MARVRASPEVHEEVDRVVCEYGLQAVEEAVEARPRHDEAQVPRLDEQAVERELGQHEDHVERVHRDRGEREHLVRVRARVRVG